MTVDQLHDAIGMLPADLLAEADQKRGQNSKALSLRRYAALAASVAVLLCGAWVYRLVGPGKTAPAVNMVKTESAAQDSRLNEAYMARGDFGSDTSSDSAAGTMVPSAVSGSLSNIPALELRWGSSATILTPDQHHWGEDTEEAAPDSAWAENLTADSDSLPTLTLEDGPLLLHWPTPPEELTAWYWSEQEEPRPIRLELHEGALALPTGHWLCQITARWGQENARYTFRAICP